MSTKERREKLSLKDTLRELLADPETLEGFILQPRSTEDFRWLRFQALELVHGSISIYGPKPGSLPREKAESLIQTCLDLGVLDGWDVQSIKSHRLEEVAHILDRVTVERRPFKKTWPLHYIERLCPLWREQQRRIGWIQGVWRFGALNEGDQNLITEVRTCLGPDGVLVVGVDSDEMAKAYKPDLTFMPLQDRMSSLAALPLVDLVVALRPGRRQLENLDEYVASVWQKIHPHIIFIGAREHPLFDRYATGAKEAGTMLLWHEEKQIFSTEATLRFIRGEGK